MRMLIVPRKGAGPIQFGMSMEQVRTAMGKPFKSFVKAPGDSLPTDAFESMGVHVFYKPPGICEAVEMGTPCDPELSGKTMIARPFEVVRDWLIALDPNAEEDCDGIRSLALGISIYCPSHQKEADQLVEGVMVFEDGYYNS